MRRLSSLLRRLSAASLRPTWLHAHGLQVARTLVATLLAFGASRALGLPEPHWAVISVLIVMRPEIDGMGAGRQRLLGTLAGCGLGILMVWAEHRGIPDWLALGAALGGLAPAAAEIEALRAAPMAAVIVSSAGGHGGGALGVGVLRLAEVATGILAGVATRFLFRHLAASRTERRQLVAFLDALTHPLAARFGVGPAPTQAQRDRLRQQVRTLGLQARTRGEAASGARIGALASELYTAVQFLPAPGRNDASATSLHAAAHAVLACLDETAAALRINAPTDTGTTLLRQAQGTLDRAAQSLRTQADAAASQERGLATVFALRRILRALKALRDLHAGVAATPQSATSSERAG